MTNGRELSVVAYKDEGDLLQKRVRVLKKVVHLQQAVHHQISELCSHHAGYDFSKTQFCICQAFGSQRG